MPLTNSRLKMFLTALALVVIVCIAAFATRSGRYFYESMLFSLHPSGAAAFAIAEWHFSAKASDDYDIDRAEYFFTIAAAKDPSIPYLFHELARISFLRGNFTRAMNQIDLQISLHGDSAPNSYYVRGLIEGYMGNYAAAESDYAHFLQFDQRDWAAMNDYAWILLKADKPEVALEVTTRGLGIFPDNPWLLNSNAIALDELGKHEAALAVAQRAVAMTQHVTVNQWLTAYPGNDPKDAAAGVASLKKAAADNMHMIEAKVASSTLQ